MTRHRQRRPARWPDARAIPGSAAAKHRWRCSVRWSRSYRFRSRAHARTTPPPKMTSSCPRACRVRCRYFRPSPCCSCSRTCSSSTVPRSSAPRRPCCPLSSCRPVRLTATIRSAIRDRGIIARFQGVGGAAAGQIAAAIAAVPARAFWILSTWLRGRAHR